jgi:hypothetical protein
MWLFERQEFSAWDGIRRGDLVLFDQFSFQGGYGYVQRIHAQPMVSVFNTRNSTSGARSDIHFEIKVAGYLFTYVGVDRRKLSKAGPVGLAEIVMTNDRILRHLTRYYAPLPDSLGPWA